MKRRPSTYNLGKNYKVLSAIDGFTAAEGVDSLDDAHEKLPYAQDSL